MIIEKIFYAVKCDNCGTVCDDDDGGWWSDRWMSEDNANNSDWEEVEDKFYCPDCVSYDDNDLLVIDESRCKNSEPPTK